MATAWPLVKQWLVDIAATLPAFSGAEIHAGIDPTMVAANRHFTAGAVMEEENAGTYSRQSAYDGTVWAEQGDVRSMIVAQSGDADGAANEAAAIAMAEALDEAIHADATLGRLLSPEATVQTSVDVMPISNPNGSATALVYVLHYTTTS
jgi:hypothetical protein